MSSRIYSSRTCKELVMMENAQNLERMKADLSQRKEAEENLRRLVKSEVYDHERYPFEKFGQIR